MSEANLSKLSFHDSKHWIVRFGFTVRASFVHSPVCTHVEYDGTSRQEMPNGTEFAVGHRVTVAVTVVPFGAVFTRVVYVPIFRQYLQQMVFYGSSPFRNRDISWFRGLDFATEIFFSSLSPGVMTEILWIYSLFMHGTKICLHFRTYQVRSQGSLNLDTEASEESAVRACSNPWSTLRRCTTFRVRVQSFHGWGMNYPEPFIDLTDNTRLSLVSNIIHCNVDVVFPSDVSFNGEVTICPTVETGLSLSIGRSTNR